MVPKKKIRGGIKMKARVIAFYLPQFHPTKENDAMWGKGFTEWTNVAKAKPLFKGHYQPQIPSDLGFYDLRVPEVRKQQAEMAKECGVEGFCYWHYWFGNGKKILDRPFNEVLKSKEPDFPFCLGWANHSWSNKTWQKTGNFQKDVTFIEQLYPGKEDYIQHFYEILPAFKDKRYITVDGKPLFLVFDPSAVPDNKSFIELWNKLARENGLTGIYFVARVPGYFQSDVLSNDKNTLDKNFSHFLEQGYDAVNADLQRYAETKVAGKTKKLFSFVHKKIFGNSLQKYDYSKLIQYFCDPIQEKENIIPQIIPRLDRTPRSGKGARIYMNSTPEIFGDFVDKAVNLVSAKESDHKIIFLQAWNEWGEGNYMEPDLKYGHAFLDTLKEHLK
jgi:hypothetical protein